jgi:hypothetical protein
MSSPIVNVPMPFSLQLNYRHCLLAACMMHEEGYYSTLSEAFRNKNPGNIESPDGKMIVYDSCLDGFVALVRDIYINKGTTLRVFIAKYAPPNENNTSEYLENVSVRSGIGQDEVL